MAHYLRGNVGETTELSLSVQYRIVQSVYVVSLNLNFLSFDFGLLPLIKTT